MPLIPWISAIGSVAVSLVASAQPQVVSKVTMPLPDLTVSGRTQPPYNLASPCAAGESAITFRLVVRNVGAGPSAAIGDYHAVWMQDNANAGWAAGAMLPPIAAGASASVDVGFVGLKNPDQMAGHHVFTVNVNGAHTVAESSYANNTMTIAVDFPAGFCGGSSMGKMTPPSGAMHAPLAAPTNINNTITQGVCAKYGGAAASLACSIGLPAGKLVLVWDYPPQATVDGYRIYTAGAAQPVATQTVQGVRLMVLDPPPVGTCYTVSAFKGGDESPKSATSFCFTAANLAKKVTLGADRTGSMSQNVYVFANKNLQDQMHDNYGPPQLEYSQQLKFGSEHNVESWTDSSKKTPLEWRNFTYRGYVHFDTSALAGHQIAKAQLVLTSTAGQICVTQYGAASSMWKLGDMISIGGPAYGGGPYAGPVARLDVTPIVQGWANGQPSNGFALTDGNSLDIYHLVIISHTCLTQNPKAALEVTYY